jgi:hypothetical protein
MNEYKFYKHLDEHSILVINKEGCLSRLYCPFIVLSKKEGKQFFVDEVIGDDGGCMFYKIKNKLEPFYLYRLLS